MKQYIPVLRKTKMFSGVGDEEIESMLSCLNARVQHYKKGEYVLRTGGHLRDILFWSRAVCTFKKTITGATGVCSGSWARAKCSAKRMSRPKAAR